MGVLHLWSILAPVKQHTPLESLKGQTLAVDLSMWVVENQGVKQMQGSVTRPYLRNLFFRVSHLSQLGVNLVFVVDGEAPEVKWEAMMKRQQARFGHHTTKGKGSKAKKQGRSHFKAWLKQCCEMLDYLGIPYVQSSGEAEAMCAFLNRNGLVDACLTDDGDAFLYGARKVYRNFTMSNKDPHVESYAMTDIEASLGLERTHLVSLSLLLGCDYCPKGVPGIGKELAVKLINSLQGIDIIQRFKDWTRGLVSESTMEKIELNVKKKALQVPGFPEQKIIDEFLVAKDRRPHKSLMWMRPKIKAFQDYSVKLMEWTTEYALEKILALVTLWDLRDIMKNGVQSTHLKPNKIVKARVRQFVPVYEVQWFKEDWDTSPEYDWYTTMEDQEIFRQCFPNTVLQFENEKVTKKKPRNKKEKKDALPSDSTQFQDKVSVPTPLDDINDSFKCLSISTKTEPQKCVPLTVPTNDLNKNTLKRDVCSGENKTAQKQVRHRTKNSKLKGVLDSISSELVEKINKRDTHVEEQGNASSDEDVSNVSLGVLPLSERLRLKKCNSVGSKKEVCKNTRSLSHVSVSEIETKACPKPELDTTCSNKDRFENDFKVMDGKSNLKSIKSPKCAHFTDSSGGDRVLDKVDLAKNDSQFKHEFESCTVSKNSVLHDSVIVLDSEDESIDLTPTRNQKEENCVTKAYETTELVVPFCSALLSDGADSKSCIISVASQQIASQVSSKLRTYTSPLTERQKLVQLTPGIQNAYKPETSTVSFLNNTTDSTADMFSSPCNQPNMACLGSVLKTPGLQNLANVTDSHVQHTSYGDFNIETSLVSNFSSFETSTNLMMDSYIFGNNVNHNNSSELEPLEHDKQTPLMSTSKHVISQLQVGDNRLDLRVSKVSPSFSRSLKSENVNTDNGLKNVDKTESTICYKLCWGNQGTNNLHNDDKENKNRGLHEPKSDTVNQTVTNRKMTVESIDNDLDICLKFDKVNGAKPKSKQKDISKLQTTAKHHSPVSLADRLKTRLRATKTSKALSDMTKTTR